MLRFSGFWLFSLAPLAVGSTAADTLFLRAGKTLKIESFSCHANTCVAGVTGGEVEVRTADVLRVEPDEEVDPEPAAAPAAVMGDAVEDGAERTLEEMVAGAAHKYALPRSLVRAVARAESAFNAAVISPKGAQGVMQLMPGTARELGVRDAFDAGENIDAGARLLRQLLEKYEGRVAEALAAYNAGQGAVARHHGIPPYRETRGYIRKVVKDFEDSEKKRSGAASGKKR
ncbi:MAG: lytic transglycosylase domain-containing protein [Vicinamibacteria bacterium]|nr:lytic transglycosylase domain-containing protein [Vicinamibacteria bacterium]